MMKAIQTILIANRGEIAVRIMRTAKAMGLKTVAIYSDADSESLHARSADLAIPIGGNISSESYLNCETILTIAREFDADAIHPGYGFLSENTSFAAACTNSEITFIGPPAPAIEIMGDKALAKKTMLAAGVPCIPGYQGEDQSSETLCLEANSIGMPVMVKAASGGGGRGIRKIDTPQKLPEAIELARSEAERSFGNSDLIIERAIEGARHVEVQIFADVHGNVIHLGERDCSIQRRHQKILEESPCPIMTLELRNKMGAAAVNVARAVNYVGAGTVEFLVDASEDFFFLEMNTRLQVEHPVTEWVTGFDLVQWQIRVAQGERLPALQKEIELNGHAIEVRLCAEDPAEAFMPSAGLVELFNIPALEGIRIDSGVDTGDTIPPFYDSMIAKVIAWGETREIARLRLRSALQKANIIGIAHNRAFLLELLDHGEFIAGSATTNFLDTNYSDGYAPNAIENATLAAAVALQQNLAAEKHFENAISVSHELRGWISTGEMIRSHTYKVGQKSFDASIILKSQNRYELQLMGVTYQVTIKNLGEGCATLSVNEFVEQVGYYKLDDATLKVSDSKTDFTLINEDLTPSNVHEETGSGKIQAPMHGQLISLLITPNKSVTKGERLAVFEAMKMQQEIFAPVAGTIKKVLGKVGQQMAAGDLIMVIEVNKNS